MTNSTTAAILVIGNEILSGRTHDVNTHYIAGFLNECGIQLREARVVPDVKQEIIDAVNALRTRYDYLFTTGGIGPTHDDITADAIAAAFGESIERNSEALAILKKYYKPEDQNEARMSMADMPPNVTLIPNIVSSAPGFIKENVYVLAGVPRIAKAMMDELKPRLKGTAPMLSRSYLLDKQEGLLAETMAQLEKDFEGVEVGSYPQIRGTTLCTNVVIRSFDTELIVKASKQLLAALPAFNAKIMEEN